MTFETSGKVQLLLCVRHPSYMFFLFHFALSTRTRNIVVQSHRTRTMSHSFEVRGGVIWNSLLLCEISVFFGSAYFGLRFLYLFIQKLFNQVLTILSVSEA
jgi:hypothetical protein